MVNGDLKQGYIWYMEN